MEDKKPDAQVVSKVMRSVEDACKIDLGADRARIESYMELFKQDGIFAKAPSGVLTAGIDPTGGKDLSVMFEVEKENFKHITVGIPNHDAVGEFTEAWKRAMEMTHVYIPAPYLKDRTPQVIEDRSGGVKFYHVLEGTEHFTTLEQICAALTQGVDMESIRAIIAQTIKMGGQIKFKTDVESNED